jgi:hypothetical protein
MSESAAEVMADKENRGNPVSAEPALQKAAPPADQVRACAPWCASAGQEADNAQAFQ